MDTWHTPTVHFPVALLLLAPWLDLAAWANARMATWAVPLAMWLTTFGGLGAIVATVVAHPMPSSAQLQAYRAAEVFAWHETLAYVVCVSAALLAVARWERWRGAAQNRHPLRFALAAFVLAGLVAATAQAGHTMAQDLGVRAAPKAMPGNN